MSQVIDDSLEAGRDAVRRHAWREAFELLSEADRTVGLSPDDLADLGDSAWWIARLEDCISAHERAYQGHLQAGDRAKAASEALELAHLHFMKIANAVGYGWFSTAERLLADEPESVAHGRLSQTRTMLALDMGELDEAVELSKTTIDIGTRYGDRDLIGFGLLDQGRALIGKGRVAEGMALLDEATVAAVGGDVGPMAAGIIYCRAISACADLSDYRRAGEWTEAARRWCERQSIAGGFPGICRVHRAEVIRLRGAFAEAEREARTAVSELSGFMASIAAEAFYEIGEIRLRIGDLPAADEAFRQAHEMLRDPQPGLSLLRLAEGKVDAAATSIKRALVEAAEPLRRAKLLPAQVLIAIESGDLHTALAAAEELGSIAEEFGTPALRACALCARGQVLLAEGNPGPAIPCLREALARWKEVDAPYEAARVRVTLANAYRAEGDAEAARMELRAAQSVFERLGAGLDARRVAEMLGDDGAALRAAAGTRVSRTFLFTDIVGSTNLAEAIGDDAWAGLLDWHDRTLRTMIAAHAGEEVKHVGDGFFVAFDLPASAMECAVAIQRALAEHRKAHGFAPQVRIGVHTAQASRKGLDYEGIGVHEAARIGALAAGGEILASRATYDAAPGLKPPAEGRTVALKGLSEPMEVLSLDWR